MSERIALDAMGGDDAPGATVSGALLSCDPARSHPIDPKRILLVGDRDAIQAELDARSGPAGFEIQHASQVIEMHDKPAVALRGKPDSSIGVGVKSVREGAAGAFVSMGNTGACVGAATIGLGTLEGVRRPGIAVTIHLTGAPLTLLDMGANVSPKPEHLLQYGMMGSVYAKSCLDTPEPKVGLLNIGGETSKGTDLLREAFGLLESSGCNFIGNVEGDEVFEHKSDVLVTDGFTGNVVLKLLEGFSGFMFGMFVKELKSHGASWAAESMARLKRQIDYSEYGGALLLGVRGPVVIGHGRSDQNAVANALDVAARALDADVGGQIVSGLSGTALGA